MSGILANTWNRQPTNLVQLVPELRNVRSHYIIPFMNIANYEVFSGGNYPSYSAGNKGKVFAFTAGSSTNLKTSSSNINGYPASFVAVVKFPDVTTAAILSTLGAVAGGSHRFQIYVASGDLIALALGSSTTATSKTISTETWYNIVYVARSSTDRRLYVNGTEQTPDTGLVTFSDTFTTVAFGCGANGAFVNGTSFMTGQVALAGWFQTSFKDPIKLSINPWSIFQDTPDPMFNAFGSASSAVSVALSGRSFTASRGTLGLTHTNALTGNASTFSRGSLGITHTNQLTGRSATFGQGTLSVGSLPINVSLSGVGATFSYNNLSPIGPQTVATAKVYFTKRYSDFTYTKRKSKWELN